MVWHVRQLHVAVTAIINNEEEKTGDDADTAAAANNEGGQMDLSAPAAEAGEMNNKDALQKALAISMAEN